MNYFIGYLISGEAATWHVDLTKDISEKFGTWKLHEKLPPHVTIFYPFSTNNIETAAELLRNQIRGKKNPGNFIMSDFDHFDDKVVFAKIEVDQSVRIVVEELRKTLKEIPEMPKDEFPNWHPHATLANQLSSQEINQILDYVLTLEKPDFTLPFDNITIFRFEGGKKWVVEKSFKFKKILYRPLCQERWVI